MLKTKFKHNPPSVKTIAHFLFITYICNDYILTYDVNLYVAQNRQSGWTRNLRTSPGYFVNGSQCIFIILCPGDGPVTVRSGDGYGQFKIHLQMPYSIQYTIPIYSRINHNWESADQALLYCPRNPYYRDILYSLTFPFFYKSKFAQISSNTHNIKI